MEYSKDPEHLQKDIEELELLYNQAKRQHTKQLLQTEIKTLRAAKSLLEQSAPKKLDEVPKDQMQQTSHSAEEIKKEQLIYTQIANYGWEQEGEMVRYVYCVLNLCRIYVTSGVDGIGKHPKQNIDCEFTDNSLDLRILDYNGKNMRLRINPLNGIIDPAKCKMKVKSNSIVLELKKGKSKYWDDVKEKKSVLGETSGLKKKGQADDEDMKDPSSSLMQMMKELYESGDDQMKRTIAESWQKAQKDKLGGGL